jgi:hypothetical protein
MIRFTRWRLGGAALAVGLFATAAWADEAPLILGCRFDAKTDVYESGRLKSSSHAPGEKTYWIEPGARVFVLNPSGTWDTHIKCRAFAVDHDLVYCGYSDPHGSAMTWTGRFVVNRTTSAYEFESFNQPLTPGTPGSPPALAVGNYDAEFRSGACKPIAAPTLADPPTELGSLVTRIAGADHWFTYIQPSYGFQIDLPGHPSEKELQEPFEEVNGMEVRAEAHDGVDAGVVLKLNIAPGKFDKFIEAMREGEAQEYPEAKIVRDPVVDVNGRRLTVLHITGTKDGDGQIGFFAFTDGRVFLITVNGRSAAQLEATAHRMFYSFKDYAMKKR